MGIKISFAFVSKRKDGWYIRSCFVLVMSRLVTTSDKNDINKTKIDNTWCLSMLWRCGVTILASDWSATESAALSLWWYVYIRLVHCHCQTWWYVHLSVTNKKLSKHTNTQKELTQISVVKPKSSFSKCQPRLLQPNTPGPDWNLWVSCVDFLINWY